MHRGHRTRPIDSEAGYRLEPPACRSRCLAEVPSLRAASEALAAARRRHGSAPFHSSDDATASDDATDGSASDNRARQTADIGAALSRNRMQLALQPVIDVRTGHTAFFEGLMRLKGLDGQWASAAAQIRAAERTGQVHEIDRRSLRLTLDVLARSPGLRMSINVSALTCADPEWLAMLRSDVRRVPHVANRLIIEITETSKIEDLRRTMTFVDNVRALGCRIALDDFGAGYTSFDSLTTLALDIVKIDGQFVRDIARNETDRAFVGAIVALARQLGIKTVAEWVVDAEGAQIVTELGIDYVQGFHLGGPQLLAAHNDDCSPR